MKNWQIGTVLIGLQWKREQIADILRMCILFSQYEERELKVQEERAQKRMEFDNQKMRLTNQLEFERSRDTMCECDWLFCNCEYWAVASIITGIQSSVITDRGMCSAHCPSSCCLNSSLPLANSHLSCCFGFCLTGTCFWSSPQVWPGPRRSSKEELSEIAGVRLLFLACPVLYCTAVYCTVLYCTVVYCPILYCTVLFSEIY